MNSSEQSKPVLQRSLDSRGITQYELRDVPGPEASYWELRNYLQQLLHELSVVQLGDSGYGLQVFTPKDLSASLGNLKNIRIIIRLFQDMLENYTNPDWRLDASEKFGKEIEFDYLGATLRNIIGYNFLGTVNSIRTHAGVALLTQSNQYIKHFFKLIGLKDAGHCRVTFVERIGLRPIDFIAAVTIKDWTALQKNRKIALLTPKEMAQRQLPRPEIDYPAFLESCGLQLQWNKAKERYEFYLLAMPVPCQKEEQHQQLIELVNNIARVPLVGGGHFVQFDADKIASSLRSQEQISLALQLLSYALENFSDASINGANILGRFSEKIERSSLHPNVRRLFSRKSTKIIVCIRMHAGMALLQQGHTAKDAKKYTGVSTRFYFTEYFKEYFGITPKKLQQRTPISPQNMPKEWGCEIINGQPEYFLKSGAAA